MKQHKHTLMLATALAVGFLMCACVVPLYMFPYTVEQLLDMQFITVSGRNTFLLGSSDDPLDSDALPTHDVTLLNGFYMSKHPITQSQFQAIMGYNPSHFQAGFGGASQVANLATTANLPVENVNWHEAIVFANRLSIREGLSPVYQIGSEANPNLWTTDPYYWGAIPNSPDARWNEVKLVHNATGYRLPTEAQWEFAARAIRNVGADTQAFNTGNTINHTQANFAGSSPFRTSAVASYAPNAIGLYDMHGNVHEWVWDWFSPYPSTTQTEPDNGNGSGTFRVTRGGGWNSSDSALRSAARGHTLLPHQRDIDQGFRVIRPQ